MPIVPPTLFMSGLRALSDANRSIATSSERFATGLRINRASDDPAGLIASEALKSQESELGARIRVLDRATLSANTADGALASASSISSGFSSSIVTSASSAGLPQASADAIDTDIRSSLNAMTSMIAQSEDSDVLDNVSVSEQIGTDAMGDPIYATYGVSDLPDLASENPALAQELAGEIQSAITERRAQIGAQQRSDEAIARASETEAINTARARSQISDADYAREAVEMSRASILAQASTRILIIGQELSKSTLDLLA